MASREEVRRVSIFINGNEADMTLKQLRSGVQKLQNELSRLVPGTQAFKNKLMELQQARRVLQNIQNDINGVGGAFGWLKTEIGKLGMLATGFLGLQFITQQFQNIISQNAKLADSISDIQKTTGMSEMAVQRLQHSFKTLDTRTSRAELNGLAEVAGKLGISGEKDVLGFVRAADQINVALGKDLGNAEAAINDLGKLTEIFHIKDAYGLETALLKTGSAINDLGAAGTANEGYIVEFTKRLGGIAPAAKMSIQDIMGMAATLDELGQPVEAAATAVSQFVMGLGNDVPKFASIAKMSVKDFSDLLKTDGNQALISVLKNLKSTGGGVQDLAENMGLAGEEGARATAALGLLSNNIELLETRQKMANASFEAGTSLTNEYNVKNNNFAATLERLSKKFNALTSNRTVTDFLIGLVNLTSKGVDGLNAMMGAIGFVTKLVIAGAAAYLAYNTVLGVTYLLNKNWLAVIKQTEAFQKLQTIATHLQAIATALWQRNMEAARAEMVALNATMAANPIGMVVAAVTALVTAYMLLRDEMSQAELVQQTLNKVKDAAVEKTVEETQKIRELNAIATDRNESLENQAKAIAKLREIMPEHLKNYTDEQIKAGQAKVAVDQYIRSLERKAELIAATEELNQLVAERRKIDRGEGADLSWWQKLQAGVASAANPSSGAALAMKMQLDNQAKLKADNQAKMDELKAQFKEDIKKNLLTDGDTGGGAAFDLANATKAQLEKQLKDDQKLLDTLKKGTADYNKVATEMVAIRKRLKEINKDTGIGGGGGEDPVKKAAAQFKALQEQVKDLNGKALEDSLSKNEKEVHDAEEKYDKLIAKEREFLKMKGVSAEQRKTTEENIANLEQEKAKDVATIRLRQEQEVSDKIRDLRASLGNAYQTELEKEQDRINRFYDERLDEAELDWDELFYLETNRQQDLTDAKVREEERFNDEKKKLDSQLQVDEQNGLAGRIAKINAEYDADIAALKKAYSKKLQASQEFQDALAVIEGRRKAAIAKETAADEKEKKKQIFQAAVDSAQSISNAVFDIGKNNRQADTDDKLTKLEKDKAEELKTKNLTEKQKQAIEEKYAAKMAAIKLKQWESDKSAALTQAAINGALAVVKALPNWYAAAAAGVAAAAQIAVIATQKPPKFEDGGYSAIDYDKPGGYVSRPTLFANSSSGRPFIAGEGNKTEYIISSAQLRNPRIANFAAMIEAQRTNRYFEHGGYSSSKTSASSAGTNYVSDSTTANDMARVDSLERSVMALHASVQQMTKIPVTISYQYWKEEMAKVAKIEHAANPK